MEEWYTEVEGVAEWFKRRRHRAQAEQSGDRQEKGVGWWRATRNRKKKPEGTQQSSGATREKSEKDAGKDECGGRRQRDCTG